MGQFKTHYERMRERIQARTGRVRRERMSPQRRSQVEREATATALLQLLEFVVSRETSVIGVSAGDVPLELQKLVDALHDYRKALEEMFHG